ncbi:virulence factor TspB C-terminal domain-related protein [Eikenella sp. Marseille-P7795]|uniref:virulence factor TspB C-terminal domain-related protein n=1 Tax=Eikenella sp. Marseille-P7795 TaxID=2866577 RepID=UPI001CE4570D|nr:virulence factor TspB C-terminal domain-related protein [Eikenella sp. Marseille-P7795]
MSKRKYQLPEASDIDAIIAAASMRPEPACAAARKIRPFIIAGAWLVAAFFVARVVRQEV